MTTAAVLSPQVFVRLPGAELVNAGLAALEALAENGGETQPAPGDQAPHTEAEWAASPELPVEALLVAIGARRLRRAGVPVPDVAAMPKEPELALYEALARQHGNDAHARYNALLRRLVSFERAAEALSTRLAKASSLSC